MTHAVARLSPGAQITGEDARATTLLPAVDLSVHIRTENGVDASLVSTVGAKPIEKIGVKPDSDGLLAAREYNFRVSPEGFVRGLRFRVSA